MSLQKKVNNTKIFTNEVTSHKIKFKYLSLLKKKDTDLFNGGTDLSLFL